MGRGWEGSRRGWGRRKGRFRGMGLLGREDFRDGNRRVGEGRD